MTTPHVMMMYGGVTEITPVSLDLSVIKLHTGSPITDAFIPTRRLTTNDLHLDITAPPRTRWGNQLSHVR
jgi:hypothetical protein